jgi:6-phosphogluconolactonase
MEGNGIICNLKTQELGDKICNYFFEALEELKEKDIIYVGLSGGRSFNEFYSTLLSRKDQVKDWNKLRFCFVDERVVNLDSDDSNYKLVNELLFSTLISEKYITSDQIITLNMDAKDIAQDYFLRCSHIDIAFFGSGEDGHIASLFPTHPLLSSESDEFISILNSPKLPKKRITLSPNMIKIITYSCIVFKGSGKQNAFNNFRDSKVSSFNYPCKLIMNSLNWIALSDLE